MASVETKGYSTHAQMTSESTWGKQSLENTLSMGVGEGDKSYSKNSGGQGATARYFLSKYCGYGIERATLPKEGRVVLADIGCASGSNSVNNLKFIIDKLRSRSTTSSPPLEFLALFNDLPSNDFNNLFQHLTAAPNHFFAAGVPGSCYQRILPRSFVHVVFSSSCLHWLSKIPDTVTDKKSPAFNKGKFWIHDSSPAVIAAYKEQALSDMINFLQARAAELVRGGLLFTVALGRKPADPNKFIDDPFMMTYMDYLDESFTDLVSKGVITSEQRDMLNMPVYHRSLEDVQEAVDSCASDFDSHILEIQNFQSSFVDIWDTTDPEELGKHIAGIYKCALVHLVEGHIGQEASDLYWEQYEKVLIDKLVPEALARHRRGLTYDFTMYLMILTRK